MKDCEGTYTGQTIDCANHVNRIKNNKPESSAEAKNSLDEFHQLDFKAVEIHSLESDYCRRASNNNFTFCSNSYISNIQYFCYTLIIFSFFMTFKTLHILKVLFIH